MAALAAGERLVEFEHPGARVDPAARRGQLAVVGRGRPGARIAERHHVFRKAQREAGDGAVAGARSEEHTSELQSLMRISYAVFCLKKKTITKSLLLHQTYFYLHNYQFSSLYIILNSTTLLCFLPFYNIPN